MLSRKQSAEFANLNRIRNERDKNKEKKEI